MTVSRNIICEKSLPFVDALCEKIEKSEKWHRENNNNHHNIKDLKNEFSSLINSDELIIMLNSILQRTLTSDGIPPASNSTLIILESELFVLTMTSLKPWSDTTSVLTNANTLLTHSSDMLIANAGKENLQLAYYSLTKKLESDIPTVKKENMSELKPKEIIYIDAKSNVLDLEVTKPSIIIRLTSKLNLPYSWVINRSDSSVTMISASVPSVGRIPLAIKLASCIIENEDFDSLDNLYEETIDILEKYTDHEYHHVRWAAIQSIYSSDSELGKKYLEKAKNDPHIHVRNAANKSINLINAH